MWLSQPPKRYSECLIRRSRQGSDTALKKNVLGTDMALWKAVMSSEYDLPSYLKVVTLRDPLLLFPFAADLVSRSHMNTGFQEKVLKVAEDISELISPLSFM
jgi:hypothetical protein